MLSRGKGVTQDPLKHPLPEDPAEAPQLAFEQVQEVGGQPAQKLGLGLTEVQVGHRFGFQELEVGAQGDRL